MWGIQALFVARPLLYKTVLRFGWRAVNELEEAHAMRMMKTLTLLVYWLLCNAVASNPSRRWKPEYKPEYVLVATAQNITINCKSKYSVVFNGTSPGPPLHFKENSTTLVRVINRIEDQKLTVVRSFNSIAYNETNMYSTGTASVREQTFSQMDLPKFLNDQLHPTTTSITLYLLKLAMLARISVTPILDSRPSPAQGVIVVDDMDAH
jgi:Multicopper oxidase